MKRTGQFLIRFSFKVNEWHRQPKGFEKKKKKKKKGETLPFFFLTYTPRCFDSSKCSASDDGRRESRSNSEHGVVRPLLYVLSHVPHTFAFCVLPVSLFWRSGALSLFSLFQNEKWRRKIIKKGEEEEKRREEKRREKRGERAAIVGEKGRETWTRRVRSPMGVWRTCAGSVLRKTRVSPGKHWCSSKKETRSYFLSLSFQNSSSIRWSHGTNCFPFPPLFRCLCCSKVKPGDVIQCRECGYRILYKKRARKPIIKAIWDDWSWSVLMKMFTTPLPFQLALV